MAVDTKNSWIRRYPSSRAPRIRLLCLPHAGGSAAFFHSWSRGFGPDIELLTGCYPGRHERINEPLVPSMDSMADAFTSELLPLSDVPLAIFGHSMGGTLGYEIALRLQQRHGITPAALLVSCRRPPHLADPFCTDPYDPEAVMAEIRRLGGTDSALLDDPDLRELVLPALCSDFKAIADYKPRPGIPMHVPIVAYVGDRDPDVDAAAMTGWADLALYGFDLRVLPGDHFYLVDQQADLMRDINARLNRLVPARS